MGKTEWKALNANIIAFVVNIFLKLWKNFNSSLVLARYSLCDIIRYFFMHQKQGMYNTLICITS